jgi:hypothetical protein
MLTTEHIVLLILGLLVIALLVLVVRMELRFRRFLKGGSGKDLESYIAWLGKMYKSLDVKHEEMLNNLTVVDTKLKKSVRGVHMLRFNPFQEAGSNQSFAIALVDENGDGLILSSLYSRERMSIFAKPIVELKSVHELSNEETQALEEAYGKIKK